MLVHNILQIDILTEESSKLSIILVNKVCQKLKLSKMPMLTNRYRIVASTNTCYYSEKQFFCFSKSRIVTCQFFFRKKTFLLDIGSLRYPSYLTNTSCVYQVARIYKRSDNFYFLTHHVTN